MVIEENNKFDGECEQLLFFSVSYPDCNGAIGGTSLGDEIVGVSSYSPEKRREWI